MKIVYMGTPDFAVGPLEALLEAGHQICAVVTQPDKQKGRGREVKYPPVKECALRHGIPVLQPVKIKAPEAVAELKTYPADLFVVAAFGQLLSEEILRLPVLGCINIHASLLPRYRGAAPIQRAIIGGERATGVTIMRMDKGLDTGAMLLSRRVPIETWETGDSLHDKLSVAGAGLIVEALERITSGTAVWAAQNPEEATYAPMLTKAEGRIDWEQSAVRIERLIRGLNSWPSAYTFYKGKTVKIWAAGAEPAKTEDAVLSFEPGTVCEVTRDSIVAVTKDGSLRITELQLEGKKRMMVKDFLLGMKVAAGDHFE